MLLALARSAARSTLGTLCAGLSALCASLHPSPGRGGAGDQGERSGANSISPGTQTIGGESKTRRSSGKRKPDPSGATSCWTRTRGARSTSPQEGGTLEHKHTHTHIHNHTHIFTIAHKPPSIFTQSHKSHACIFHHLCAHTHKHTPRT